MTAYQTYTTEELLVRLASHDEMAFTQIFSRYHARVYHYVAGYVKDPVLAEDLVHEIFLKIWEIRGRLRIDTSFEAYLFRIAHNKAINALKKLAFDKKMQQRVLDHLQANGGSEGPDIQTFLKYDQLLEDALNTLPPQRRKVFVLCRQEGKSYDETAAELGISRNTVKEHMVKAVKTLKVFLSDKGDIAVAIVLLQKIW